MADELPLIKINADELSSINNPNPCPLKRKRSAGRRKIPIELIQNKDALQVCFLRRRSGLFHKAHELFVLCGAHVEVIAFSPTGNPYICAYPSNSPSMFAKDKAILDQNSESVSNSQKALSRQVSELSTRIEAANRKKEALQAAVKGIRHNIWSLMCQQWNWLSWRNSRKVWNKLGLPWDRLNRD